MEKYYRLRFVHRVVLVAQWIAHQTSNLRVEGSSPFEHEFFYFFNFKKKNKRKFPQGNQKVPHAGLQPAASRLEVWRAMHCANGAALDELTTSSIHGLTKIKKPGQKCLKWGLNPRSHND